MTDSAKCQLIRLKKLRYCVLCVCVCGVCVRVCAVCVWFVCVCMGCVCGVVCV